jgi:hypothetical protein
LTGKILRPGCTGCITRGKPVPLQATQVCSLILGVILSLSGRLSWAASFRAAHQHLKGTTPAKGDWLGRSFQFRRGGPTQNHNAFDVHSFQSASFPRTRAADLPAFDSRRAKWALRTAGIQTYELAIPAEELDARLINGVGRLTSLSANLAAMGLFSTLTNARHAPVGCERRGAGQPRFIAGSQPQGALVSREHRANGRPAGGRPRMGPDQENPFHREVRGTRSAPGAYCLPVVMNSLKLVGAAALVLISSGAWPNPRYGPIAIGLCIMAAVVLHFVAP